MKLFLSRAGTTLRHYLSLWHLKRVLVFLWVDLVLLSFVRRGKSESVLIVKYDQFGDYILVRNFLRRIRDCERYKGRRIVLAANRALREFIELYDATAFDEIVWIDRKEMLDTVWARFANLRKVKRLGARTALQFMYGLEAFSADCVMRASGASERYGRSLPREATEGAAVKLGNQYYSEVVDPRQVVFDFYRHAALFAAAVPGVEPPRDTRFSAVRVAAPEFSGPFAIFMPGASDAFREWPPERFGAVARHLSETRGWQIAVLGTKEDAAKASAIAQAAPGAVVHNLCGSLNLPQVAWVASQCALGLTNDSGGIHLLAALGRPGVAVSNCFSFGYFHPYPRELSETVTFVYPDAFYALGLSMSERRKQFWQKRRYAITDVMERNVIERIEALLHPPFRDPIHEIAP